MSLVRTIVLIAAAIAVMPTDEGQQEKLRVNASNAMTWAMTYCERNRATCAAGSELWAAFVLKAEFAGKVAYGLIAEAAMPGSSGTNLRTEASDRQPLASTPVRRKEPPLFERGTLTEDDLRPQWRGNAQARSR